MSDYFGDPVPRLRAELEEERKWVARYREDAERAEAERDEARADAQMWEATWRDLDDAVDTVLEENKQMRKSLKRIAFTAQDILFDWSHGIYEMVLPKTKGIREEAQKAIGLTVEDEEGEDGEVV